MKQKSIYRTYKTQRMFAYILTAYKYFLVYGLCIVGQLVCALLRISGLMKLPKNVYTFDFLCIPRIVIIFLLEHYIFVRMFVYIRTICIAISTKILLNNRKNYFRRKVFPFLKKIHNNMLYVASEV